ncbi:unnamed protein product [Periconia digitata]|uniref:Uncharacterized protein n=1 Tax=Periconia digitata TaxID=1303443 RepID=A0A9W4UQ04_9PLEO|nr:unnamed protein product [Periconia digitata]
MMQEGIVLQLHSLPVCASGYIPDSFCLCFPAFCVSGLNIPFIPSTITHEPTRDAVSSDIMQVMP